MFATVKTIVHDDTHFSYDDAEHVSQLVALSRTAKWIVIDLRNTEETTTSAFARLVLLRRELLQSGRDLCLAGLRDRAHGLYEINRLEGVLPRA